MSCPATSSSISRRAHLSSWTGPSGCGKSNSSQHRGRARHRFRWPHRSWPGLNPSLAFVFQTPRLLPVAVNCRGKYCAGVAGRRCTRRSYPGVVGQRRSQRHRTFSPVSVFRWACSAASLSRALSFLEPDILLMDEPFVFARWSRPRWACVQPSRIDLWTRRPTTVLFVTHDRHRGC